MIFGNFCHLLVQQFVGSAVVGGGGPGASHGIICPHCTQKTQPTIDQYIVPAMTSSLAAVGKKGSVFFLNEIASKFRSSCDCLQFSVWTTSGPSEL